MSERLVILLVLVLLHSFVVYHSLDFKFGLFYKIRDFLIFYGGIVLLISIFYIVIYFPN